MNILRRRRVFVDRKPRNGFRLQELSDLVELAARNDMAPTSHVRVFVDGVEVRDFRIEVA